MRRAVGAGAGRALASCALLFVASWQPVQAQWQIALGFSFADTRTNALGLGTTLTWNPARRLFLHGILDAEHGVPDMKEGLEYLEPERIYIVDQEGTPQNPRGDELWQGQGWNLHAAAYATFKVWRISGGPGLAYNGLDGSVSSGLAFVAVADVTSRSHIDVEFLRGGSWRLRLAIGFWSFP